MSATNSTPIINLPLFIGTDKPAWLTDWNGAMNTIDSSIAALQTAEAGTATSLATLAQSVEALSGTVEQHTTAIQTVTTATAGNTGSINTINALIGNGQPTTTDKTIIGAINEIYADIGSGDGVDADEVNYDNTSSGLTATDVQAAIDELANSGSDAPVLKASYTTTAADDYAGIKAALHDAVAGLTDFEKSRAYIKLGTRIFVAIGSSQCFQYLVQTSSVFQSDCINLQTAAAANDVFTRFAYTGGAWTATTNTIASGTVVELYA